MSGIPPAGCLARVNPYKAPGPDGLRGRAVAGCTYQLKGVFTRLFQFLLDTHTVPLSWKRTTIIPVPKNSKPVSPNDFRPIAILCKCMERVVLKHLPNTHLSDQSTERH